MLGEDVEMTSTTMKLSKADFGGVLEKDSCRDGCAASRPTASPLMGHPKGYHSCRIRTFNDSAIVAFFVGLEVVARIMERRKIAILKALLPSLLRS
jgi:hypothetical protein